MVLVRDRRAEDREDAVASAPHDVAVVVLHRVDHQLERGIDDGRVSRLVSRIGRYRFTQRGDMRLSGGLLRTEIAVVRKMMMRRAWQG